MPRKTQRSSANASRVASNKNKPPRETAAQRRAKGVYTKAELAKAKNANKTVKESGNKRPSSAKPNTNKSVLNDPMYSPGTTTKTTKSKSSGTKGAGSGKRKTVSKAKGTTKGVVKAKSSIKSSSTGPKRVAVPKTKKQERQETRATKKQERQKVRTQRKAKRAADARNEANKILKKTSGTGKKVTSRDQRKLKRLRGKYNRNTK